MKKMAVMAMVAMIFGAGCAAKDLSILQKTYTLELAGQTKEYVSVDAAAPAGLITRTVVIYDDKGKQEYAETESVGGPLNRALDNIGAAAVLSAGLGSGMAAQGAANVVQNSIGGGASATGGAGGIGGTGGVGIGGTAVSGSAANAAAASSSNAVSTVISNGRIF